MKTLKRIKVVNDIVSFNKHRLINQNWHRFTYRYQYGDKTVQNVEDIPPFYQRSEAAMLWLAENANGEWMFRYGREHQKFHVFLTDDADSVLLQITGMMPYYDGCGDWYQGR